MYFKEHMRECQLYCQKSPTHMINAALMAMLSARQSWSQVGEQMADVKVNGLASKYLFGYKRAGYKYLLDKKDGLFSRTLAQASNELELLDLWATVPGLGLAKAGFTVQLITGAVGCLDSHNMRLYDVPASLLRLPNTLSTHARRVKIEVYRELCKSLGGSASLWEQWCLLMAAKYPTKFKSATVVSAAHVTYLKKGPQYD